ncbi:MAG: metalloregulator ArsR/SmtB family transcription factor [Chloroflexota bacterium]
MQPFEFDFIVAPPTISTEIALEPAHSALNNLVALNKAQTFSGLDAWVDQANLTPEQLHRNRLVLEGLFYALPLNNRWPNFPASIDYLAGQKPADLVQQVLRAYLRLAQSNSGADRSSRLPAPSELLADRTFFLEFLQTHFTSGVDLAVEAEAHTLLNDPTVLQTVMVDHLREMWDTVLEPDWSQTEPLLAAVVDAFQRLDLSQLSKLEAAEQVVGRPLTADWEIKCLKDAEEVVFVPSVHTGPYLTKIFGRIADRSILWLFFPARQPDGISTEAPVRFNAALIRAELLIRLNALGDDTRLRILSLLTEHDELCSKDILTQLNLSQSAASRHLKQLSASGFLLERAQASAKCYRLNPQRVEDTLNALAQFLRS